MFIILSAEVTYVLPRLNALSSMARFKWRVEALRNQTVIKLSLLIVEQKLEFLSPISCTDSKIIVTLFILNNAFS